MAGHSKWANIKHKKGREDAKRGKIFSKLVKKITAAARRGGGDIDVNNELRLYVDKAKAANMPKDNIERAIKKGTGELEGVSYDAFNYEGYGPGGVAIYLTGATDNRNRIVADLRHHFNKNNGNLGEDGCVNWMFKDRGIFSISEDQIEDVDELMMFALENGAVDVEHEDGVVTILCEYSDFMALRGALEEAGYNEFITDELTKLADVFVTPDVDIARQNLRLFEILEDEDDVENVYHNLELSDEVAAELAAE
ncbi:YebC/PmpR family DNA-binding transcriptional regulator [Bradymonas sediminis]|uniref:Probable transcriptional regulatory protein DN745_14620 n=1 Tax=Bradymonas sediminis TaxID=1548548 RepID=A0A2Z4FNH6_9DELT|nr:YebC/PmpR family DNA-binding transcriptional regulator [Bradymonas sediminis]AWV90493.1 YebC/PmpR family DNA-binding transcriptional regulator [Bradymonas sediminis]TDP72115.1 YebC/PmpR family DNA-binding regulatory protein [Bradymonas sediminis]